MGRKSQRTSRFFDSPEEAVRDAQVVTTDVWASMGQEDEADARLEAFKGYQITPALLDRARADACFLHCLPAHQGEEISEHLLLTHEPRAFGHKPAIVFTRKKHCSSTSFRGDSLFPAITDNLFSMSEVKLTKAQTRVLDVIQQSIRDEGRPPTRAEIADALGFRSINAAESHLRALERRGAIRLQGGASRGIQCLVPSMMTTTTNLGFQ